MPELGKPQNTIDIIKKYDFRFRKKFGQNFLIDTNVLGKIADSACIDPEDCVLEIGPGIGTLTQYLAERARQVVAVEIDPELIPILSETLAGFPNAEVIHADIMKTDIRELAETYNGGKPLNVVANLPYYITTPIIMSLLEDGAPVKSITVMIQKEVAERMQAGPGGKEYGALSLAVQYYCSTEIVANVPPNCFIPRPNVGSCVIRLNRYLEPPVKVRDPEKMFRIIRAAFNQRRNCRGRRKRYRDCGPGAGHGGPAGDGTFRDDPRGSDDAGAIRGVLGPAVKQASAPAHEVLRHPRARDADY